MTWKRSPIDIYFHMANHYRKLRSVKSVVDTSPPTGYYEKLQCSRQSRPQSRTQDIKRSHSKQSSSANSDKICNESKYYSKLKKHEVGKNGKYTSTRSQSLPARPQTRRKLSDMPNSDQYTSRAQSTGPPSARGNATPKLKQRCPTKSPPNYAYFLDSLKQPMTEVVIVDYDQAFMSTSDEKFESPSTAKKQPTPAPRKHSKKRDTSYKKSIAEHDYLQFSLRITEDIIRNDLYTNEDMRRVFNSHIEANRGRLEMARMNKQIENLCRELNIPSDDSQINEAVTKSQIRAARQNAKSALTCICCPVIRPLSCETENCACGSIKCLPLKCTQHGSKTPDSSCSTKGDVSDAISNVSQEIIIKAESATTFESDTIDEEELRYTEDSESGLKGSNCLLRNEKPVARGHIRSSAGFHQLSSLSCVTEMTEPTTSSETVNTKYPNSKPTTSSTIEFNEQDVLPGFENLESDQDKPLDFVNKNYFESDSVKISLSASLQSNGSKTNSPTLNLDGLASSDCLNENMYWLTCCCSKPQQLLDAESQEPVEYCGKCIKTIEITKCMDNPIPKRSDDAFTPSVEPPEVEKNTKQSEKPQNSSENISRPSSLKKEKVPQTRIVQSAPPIYHQTSSDQQLKSESINSPTSSSSTKTSQQQLSVELKCSSSDTCKSSSTSNKFLGDPQFEILEILEPSNIKVRGANNEEQEFVLAPGCIYIPKNSTIITQLPKEVMKTISFAKNVSVSTDAEYLGCVKKMKEKPVSSESNNELNKKSNVSIASSSKKEGQASLLQVCDSTSKSSCISDTGTYCKLHETALKSFHYSSFVSDLSQAPNIPTAIPITESELLSQNLSRPPKVLIIKDTPITGDNSDSLDVLATDDDHKDLSYKPETLHSLSQMLNIPQAIPISESELLSQNLSGPPKVLIIKDTPLTGDTSDSLDVLATDDNHKDLSYEPETLHSLSQVRNIPQAIPISESELISQNLSGPPKVLIIKNTPPTGDKNDSLNGSINKRKLDVFTNGKHKDWTHEPDKLRRGDQHVSSISVYTEVEEPIDNKSYNSSASGYQTNDRYRNRVRSASMYERIPRPNRSRNIIEQLNDYDLTPQRDNNVAFNEKISVCSHLQNGVHKDTLLLGDEYEIKNNMNVKDSITSYYDNGLPYAISKFYPSSSTQTQSSDWLLPPSISPLPPALPSSETSSVEKKESDDWHWSPKDESRDTLFSGPKRESISEEQFKKSFDLMFSTQFSDWQLQKLKKLEADKKSISESFTDSNMNIDSTPLKIQESKIQMEEKQDSQIQMGHKPGSEIQVGQKQESKIKMGPKQESKMQMGPKQESKMQMGPKQESKMQMGSKQESIMQMQPKKESIIYMGEPRASINQMIQKQEPIIEVEQNDATHEEEKDEEEEELELETDSAADVFMKLDREPSFKHRPSMLVNIERVTEYLKKIRTGTAQNRQEEQLQEEQPMDLPVENQEKDDSMPKDNLEGILQKEKPLSLSIDEGKIPYIEVRSESETLLQPGLRSSNETEKTVCCGLKKLKKKKRRDILDAESSNTTVNVSTIPDDQLFVIDTRRPTVNTGYGAERKSLRFDYSAMKDFNKKVDASVVDLIAVHDNPYINSSPEVSPAISDDIVPQNRQKKISYRASSTSRSKMLSNSSSRQKVTNTEEGSVVDILTTQKSPSAESFCMETQDDNKNSAQS